MKVSALGLTGAASLGHGALAEETIADSQNTFRLEREIPVEEGFDVIVAGGGPAGSAAAICAARLGAKCC